MSKHTIGIDISKAFLDVATYPEGEIMQFSNDKKGHKALIKWFKTIAFELIVFEATGAYHKILERLLSDLSIDYVKVNPRQARSFKQATGKLAKTDQVDAIMLARFGALMDMKPTKNSGQTIETLQELIVSREALVKERTRIKNRSYNLHHKLLKRQSEKRLKQIKKDIAAIDALCLELIGQDDSLQNRFDILISIPGLGQITALTIVATMPELGTMDKRQVAALAGLAPITRQSGKWQGKSYIQGGRRIVRNALYMPALVAIRYNPQLKQKYQAMMERQKPAKVAITAIMRTMITIANALIRDNRKWV